MIDKIYYINREQLHDVVVAHLYAVSILDDDEDATITEINNEDEETYELIMEIRKR